MPALFPAGPPRPARVTSPVRYFRILCLACLEPDRAVTVVAGGRSATACLCGNVEVRDAYPGERSTSDEVSA